LYGAAGGGGKEDGGSGGGPEDSLIRVTGGRSGARESGGAG
jgi:hypothetical protein